MRSFSTLGVFMPVLAVLLLAGCGARDVVGPRLVMVAAPVFAPAAGTFQSSQVVTITCSTPGAVVHYTTDGTEPTESSPLYTVPIQVPATTVLRARAWKADWLPSGTISTGVYTITGSCAMPVLSIPSGVYTSAQLVSMSCATPGAAIRYTTDGTEPGESSNLYAGPLNVAASTVLRARAWKTDWAPSVATAAITYTITGSCATPVLSLPAGTYTSAQQVSMSCATPGASIRYTIDGSEPVESSSLYTGPVEVSSSSSFRAKAWKADWAPSAATLPVAFIITGTVGTPLFSLPPGTYTSARVVGMSCATPDAVIRYTTDGSEPDESSTRYVAPIDITASTVLRARAWKTDWAPSSATAAATYVITGTVAMPAISLRAGTYTSAQTVAMNCATPGATIRFTTDGSEPGESSEEYEGPIGVAVSTVLRARAWKADWETSAVTPAMVYTITGSCAPPVASLPGGIYTSSQSVELSCATAGATIRYTTDGTPPDEASSIYVAPVIITTSTVLRARAWKQDWAPSAATAPVTYTITGNCAVPVLLPPGGVYTSAPVVSMSCDTPGATIRFTTDGTEPVETSTAYDDPIHVTETTVLRARAWKQDWAPSATTPAVPYTITGTVAMPVITPAGGSFAAPPSILVECATAGAIIRYTIDGTEPSESSPVYGGPVPLRTSATLRVRAWKEDWAPSDAGSATFTIRSRLDRDE